MTTIVEWVTDIRTGERSQRSIDVPIVSVADGQALDAAAAQLETNRAAIIAQADLALTDLRAYRDLASPTNAQTVAVVKLLCRVCISLIRLVLLKLDGTN